MINGGYILQPRKIDDSESSIKHAPPLVRELWAYLLRKVSHKDNGKFKRGQGFFRFEDIQNDLSWHVGYRVMRYSKPQLTKSLRRLREGNAIATSKATRGIYITILNYDYYQDPANYESNTEETTKVSRRKREGRTINKNVKEVKNKECKEVKNKNHVKTKTSSGAEINRPTWEAYSKAYEFRYKSAPLRNHKQNSLIKQFVKRVGVEDAPHVIAFYLQHKMRLYIASGHALDLAVRDAEKIYTEWRNGRQVTETSARQQDRMQTTAGMVNEIISEREENGR